MNRSATISARTGIAPIAIHPHNGQAVRGGLLKGTRMTIEQIKAIREVADAIVDAVRIAGPLGAPSGVLYAALMASGCSLNQFQSLMSGLVRAGKLRQEGLLYFVVTKEVPISSFNLPSGALA